MNKPTKKLRQTVVGAYLKQHFREIDHLVLWVAAIKTHLKNNTPKREISGCTQWSKINLMDVRPLHPNLKGSRLSHTHFEVLKEVFGWHNVRDTEGVIYFN